MLVIAKKGKLLLSTKGNRVILALIVLVVSLVVQFKKSRPTVPPIEIDWESELPRLSDERVNGNTILPFYFGDEVASLVYKGHVLPISWSFSKAGDLVLCFEEESGYPGFDQPMIVKGNPVSLPDLDLMESGKSSFLIYTDYGNFEYKVRDIFVCIRKENQWIRCDTGELLTRKNQEMLYVMCEQENGFLTIECEKIDGTTIDLGGTYGSDF